MRVLCVLLTVILFYIFGIEFSSYLKSKIKTVEDYILFLLNLKSSVVFSKMSFEEIAAANTVDSVNGFCKEFLKSGDMEITLKNYKPKSKEEKICIETVKNVFTSFSLSDTELIESLCLDALEKLKNVKQIAEEENKAKIKISPSVSVMLGLFVSILIL